MISQLPLPECLRANISVVQEPETDGIAWDERHLHCIWADSRLRPRLFTTGGEEVEVVEPGVWNGGAGPDFRAATLRLGGSLRKGDVEIHIRPSDWNAHKHDADPRYGNVVLHVTWFPPSPGSTIPDIPLALLRDSMLERPSFSFDQIDPDAYPWMVKSDHPRPCRDSLASATPATVGAVLEWAGRKRLARKAREIQSRAGRAESLDQSFYAETMGALGFPKNAAAMRALASALPVADLAALPSDEERYAALLARGGLLPDPDSGSSAETLWEAAFRAGASFAPDATQTWNVSASRPVNHPRVRLAVAARLFRSPSFLRKTLENLPRLNPKVWARLASETFRSQSKGAQDLLSGKLASAKGLLGKERINSILCGAIVPLLACSDSNAWKLLDAIPGEALGGTMKEMAFRLLGGDHNPALYTRSALRMQGLLELWKGCCEASEESCRTCPLARTGQS